MAVIYGAKVPWAHSSLKKKANVNTVYLYIYTLYVLYAHTF